MYSARAARSKRDVNATAMEVPTIDAISVNMASVVTAVPLLEVPAPGAERDGAAAKTATRAATEEARPPLTLTGVSSVGRDGASIAGGDLDAAVATVQARGTPVAIEHEEEAGAFSWMFGSAPQKPAVSTFGVVLERDEEADDGTKHKRKSMAL